MTTCFAPYDSNLATLDHRYQERQRLTGAGMGCGHQVFARKCVRDRFRLDRHGTGRGWTRTMTTGWR